MWIFLVWVFVVTGGIYYFAHQVTDEIFNQYSLGYERGRELGRKEGAVEAAKRLVEWGKTHHEPEGLRSVILGD